MSLYELNPELDSPQVYGNPASDPVGTVRAHLGPNPSEFEPAVAAYYKVREGMWAGAALSTTRDDNWVKDCPVIYRPRQKSRT